MERVINTGPFADSPFTNSIEFSSAPLKSWIPAAVLGIMSILAGISFIVLFGAQYWYLSATLGLLGTTLLMRASPETYKFDGVEKSFLLVKRNLFGTKTFELSFREIKEVKFEESVDTQGTRGQIFPNTAGSLWANDFFAVQAVPRPICTCFFALASDYNFFRIT